MIPEAWSLFRKTSPEIKATAMSVAIWGTLLCNNEVRAESPPSPLTTAQTEKSAGLASEFKVRKLADLQSRLDKREIRVEEYIALKEQWIKDHPPSPPGKKPNPPAAPITNLSKEQANPTATAMVEIRKSAQSPEEKIRQVDSLIRSQLPREIAKTTSPRTQDPLATLPVPLDPDVKASQDILAKANKLSPEARIAEIERQQTALQNNQRALRKKAEADVSASSQNSKPTPP